MTLEEYKAKRLAELISRLRSNSEGCLEYTMSRNKYGYGLFSIGKHFKATQAHRAMWILLFGPLDPSELVLHMCDNPPCCNPAHLYIGTHLNNAKDAQLRGRKGKLCRDDVVTMRVLYNTGECTPAHLAYAYRISKDYARTIVTGKYYESIGHIADNPIPYVHPLLRS